MSVMVSQIHAHAEKSHFALTHAGLACRKVKSQDEREYGALRLRRYKRRRGKPVCFCGSSLVLEEEEVEQHGSHRWRRRRAVLWLWAPVVAVVVFLRKRRPKPIVREKPATGDAVLVEPFPGEAAASARSPSPSTQSPGESKTLDVAWSHPSLSLSTQPTLPASALTDAASISPTVGTGTTQRERELEARLAALESQIHYVVAEPPPYVPPPPSE
ncbi:hypothetical protein HMN09_01305500 [Mycena chlorophos]|uniref:Uncharacterized protein n=1 Tax=Mycena chlorophos TaxID=658473 RepID=A0A8H6RZV6_MYCCL|nr:hypothetical protein HMN09_01305500 [Mycena chlorophos]